MQKLYEKQEVLFAVLWIAAYCTVIAPIKQRFGIGSVWMLLALLVFAGSITAFVKASHAEEKYGLAGWPRDTKRFLYFLPMWILATGNLWDGFVPSCRGTELLISVLCMSLVGFVEEMLFRGFLFKALLAKEKTAAAIVVSSVTFGMGHIVNLFAGQASFETFVQIVFAISWGFILTMVFYRSGSLLPGIIAFLAKLSASIVTNPFCLKYLFGAVNTVISGKTGVIHYLGVPEEAVLLSIETPQAAPASGDDTIRVTNVTERFFPFQRFSAIFRLPKRTGGGRKPERKNHDGRKKKSAQGHRVSQRICAVDRADSAD